LRGLSPQPGSLIAVVISAEAEIAAILREFLTHDGYQVRAEDGSESLDVLLDHVRPRLVLVDVDHAEAFSAGFIERARGVGAAVVAFSPSRDDPEVRELAAAHNLAGFAFPLPLRRFRDTLRAALAAP
jgi:DNA-binding response OmpR family regulator